MFLIYCIYREYIYILLSKISNENNYQKLNYSNLIILLYKINLDIILVIISFFIIEPINFLKNHYNNHSNIAKKFYPCILWIFYTLQLLSINLII